jgi:predicted secreted hydrolase
MGLDLSLTTEKPPVLHDGDGWIDFGPAGGSYYYSRTSMSVSGSLTLAGRDITVRGTAWFDHQWGDFISVGGGGWDWFAMNLADGTDLTLSLVRAAGGTYPLVYGTIVDARGRSRHLDRSEFTVTVTGRWRSPTTGIDYPAGWIVQLPGERLRIELAPTVADQELDTRATTGVVYWEGSQVVRATRSGTALGGEAYVELTGYGP